MTILLLGGITPSGILIFLYIKLLKKTMTKTVTILTTLVLSTSLAYGAGSTVSGKLTKSAKISKSQSSPIGNRSKAFMGSVKPKGSQITGKGKVIDRDSISNSRNLVHGKKDTANMRSVQRMIIPSYITTEETPDLEGLGVAITLRPPPSGETAYRVGQTVHIDGAFNLGGQELGEYCQNHPHTCILIVVVRRDRLQIWTKTAMRAHDFAPMGKLSPPFDEDSDFSRTVQTGGCFDVDLLEFLGIPRGPGRYWVTAYLGDHVSERLSLEIIKS